MDLMQAEKILDGTAQEQLDRDRYAILDVQSRRAEERQQKRQIRAQVAAAGTVGVPPTIQALTVHERRNYSIQRLISNQLERHRRRGFNAASEPPPLCLEDEINISLQKDLDLLPEPGASFVPLFLGLGLDTKTGGAGAYTIQSRIGDVVDYLRAKSVVLRLGAQMLSGLRNGIAIPVQSAASSASWLAENGGVDAAQTDSQFGQYAPSARTLVSTTGYSRMLLGESSLPVEQFLRRDLGASLGDALDRGAIAGSGTEGQPIGLLNVTSTQVVSLGVNGAAPTAAALISLEQAIADASADIGGPAWITTPTMRSKLRVLPIFTGATVPCWTCDANGDYCLGQPAVVTRHVPQTLTKGSSTDCHGIISGSFPAMTVVTWGVMSILADEFSLKKRGMVEITAHLLCDVCVTRPSSFGIIGDARNV